MADGHSKQLSLNKFFDRSTPSMRKDRDRGKKNGKKKRGKKEKRLMEIVATTSLPAVDRWNAARSRKKYHTDGVGLSPHWVGGGARFQWGGIGV